MKEKIKFACIRVTLGLAFLSILMSSYVWMSGTGWAYGQSGGNSRFIMVSASYSHVVAIKDDFTVWTWGRNNNGQLGYDTDGVNQTIPRQVQLPFSTPALSGAKSVAAGGDPVTNTAFTVVLMRNGSVWTWGDNSNHQLGNATLGGHEPTQVMTELNIPLQLSANTKQVAAGFDHAAVLLEDGSIKSWGGNEFGQLGNNSYISPPYAVDVNNGGPTNVSGFTSISLGRHFSAAVFNNNTVFTWGKNDLGQLGDGTTANRPYADTVHGLNNVNAISAGSNHTLAIENGKAWAWGDNDKGQLGFPTVTGVTYSAMAERVHKEDASGTAVPITGAIAVAAGGSYSMVIDGSGFGYSGISYNSPSIKQSVWIDDSIAAPTGITSGSESLYILTSDKLYVAGLNNYGQLGLGRTSGVVETPADMTPYFDVAVAGSELNWESFRGVNESDTAVKYSMILPSNGSNETTITWTSSNTDVLDDDGTVHRPLGENVTVTLTATILKATEPDAMLEKSFGLTILAEGETEGGLNAEWAFANVAGTKLRIHFGKPLDTEIELNPEHFTMMDGDVGVQSASYDDNDVERRTIILQLSDPLPDSHEGTMITIQEGAVWARDETTNGETELPIVPLKILDLNHNGKFSIDDVVRLATLDWSNFELGGLGEEMPGGPGEEPGEEPDEPLDYDTLLMLLQFIEPLYSE